MPFGLKKGNLVQNGGFEQGLAGWLGIANVELAGAPLPHEGLVAAAMGKADNTAEAEMFQDVPVLPRHTYRLELYAAGAQMRPADLIVDVHWICGFAGDTGCALTGGPLVVPGVTTGSAVSGAWKAVSAYTEAAPPGACLARICLRKPPGTATANYLLVDDVIFAERD